MDILGQNHAKRALEIAVLGQHSALLIGPPGCGKSLLISEYAKLCNKQCNLDWQESHTCLCGFFGDSMLPCFCTEDTIALFQTHLRKKSEQTDIIIQVPRVPVRDLITHRKSETLDAVITRIKNTQQHAHPTRVDFASNAIFEKWASRSVVTARQWASAQRVASTIAHLDSSDCIEPRHAAEAIQYKIFPFQITKESKKQP